MTTAGTTDQERFASGPAVVALQRTDDALLRDATDTDDAQVGDAVPRRRLERLAARGLLRRLLADVVDGSAAAAPLVALDSGKPGLAQRPEVGVSLSHSHGWVAAAVVPRGQVGVDVQVAQPCSDRLLHRCLQEADLPGVRRLRPEERAAYLAHVWSVQEACVKATGDGFRGRPWSVPVGAHERAGQWRSLGWAALAEVGAVALAVAVEEAT